MITQEYLKEILDYNPETGIFTWRVSKSGIKGVGSVAGNLNKQTGYNKIEIIGKCYLAHRLAWLYVYGEFPKGMIDHINGVRGDNRIENLRDVTSKENNQNTYKHRNGRLVGTSFHKKAKKWKASIVINSKNKHLGYFNTELEAHQAYMNKLKEFEK